MQTIPQHSRGPNTPTAAVKFCPPFRPPRRFTETPHPKQVCHSPALSRGFPDPQTTGPFFFGRVHPGLAAKQGRPRPEGGAGEGEQGGGQVEEEDVHHQLHGADGRRERRHEEHLRGGEGAGGRRAAAGRPGDSGDNPVNTNGTAPPPTKRE